MPVRREIWLRRMRWGKGREETMALWKGQTLSTGGGTRKDQVCGGDSK
jgi:hypothetical protein